MRYTGFRKESEKQNGQLNSILYMNFRRNKIMKKVLLLGAILLIGTQAMASGSMAVPPMGPQQQVPPKQQK